MGGRFMSRWVVYELVGGLWLDGWFMSGRLKVAF